MKKNIIFGLMVAIFGLISPVVAQQPLNKNAIALRVEERLIPMTYKTESWIGDSTTFHFYDEVSLHIVKVPKNVGMTHTGTQYSEEEYPSSIHMFGISSPMRLYRGDSAKKGAGSGVQGQLILEGNGVHLPFIVTEIAVQKQLGKKPEKSGYYVLDYNKSSKDPNELNTVTDPVTGVVYRISFEGGDTEQNLPVYTTTLVTLAGVVVPLKRE